MSKLHGNRVKSSVLPAEINFWHRRSKYAKTDMKIFRSLFSFAWIATDSFTVALNSIEH